MIHKGKDSAGTFCIYDAKCYVPVLGPEVKGVLGVESATKQFLYQTAYNPFVLAQGFDSVVNVFLVPADNDTSNLMGRVAFPGAFPHGDKPFTNRIDMWSIPTQEIFNCYLEDRLAIIDIRKMLWSMSLEAESDDEKTGARSDD